MRALPHTPGPIEPPSVLGEFGRRHSLRLLAALNRNCSRATSQWREQLFLGGRFPFGAVLFLRAWHGVRAGVAAFVLPLALSSSSVHVIAKLLRFGGMSVDGRARARVANREQALRVELLRNLPTVPLIIPCAALGSEFSFRGLVLK